MEKKNGTPDKARREKVRLTLARPEELATREQRERFVAAVLGRGPTQPKPPEDSPADPEE